MYVCMYTCKNVYMYICIYVYMYICIYVYMYICIYVYMYICIYAYMHICIYVYIYLHICIYVHTYRCKYPYTYIRTEEHTQALTAAEGFSTTTMPEHGQERLITLSQSTSCIHTPAARTCQKRGHAPETPAGARRGRSASQTGPLRT